MVQKSVLITGCSEGGIGDALAKAFHKKGLLVFATARNLAKVQHLKEVGLEIIALDVTDSISIKQAVESVAAITGGKLDILVNNSGAGYNLPLLDTEESAARAMFDVNVFAPISVTKAFSLLLISSKGTVINIGSVAGKAPMPWQGYYNASKAAVNLLTDQLRVELAPFNVKAINIITGGVKTKFFDNLVVLKLPKDSLYTPAKEEIEPLMGGTLLEKHAMDVNVYAEAVVKNALKKNPKNNLWLGAGAFPIWFVWAFLWDTVWDFLFQGPFNLRSATKKIQAAESAKTVN